MTVKDLAEKLRAKFSDLDGKDLEFIVENFFGILKKAIKKGINIELRNFGRFELSKTKSYFFVNPKNKQKYYLPSKVRVVFKIGKEFKDLLNTPFIAGLDLGTQTFRLILGKVNAGKLYFYKSFRENVRLGEGLQENGNITLEAKERAIEALRKFKELFEKYKVVDYYAIGTAVFRKAKNAKDLLEEIEKKTSFKVKVLSPEEEGRMVVEGVLYGIKRLGLSLNNFLVVDVGGGSTEFIYFKEGKLVDIKSIEIGAVQLKEFFNLRYPLTKRVFQSLTNFVSDQLKGLPKDFFEKIIATGGTSSLMGSLDLQLIKLEPVKIHGHIITADRLKKLILKLSDYPLSRIKSMKGMEEGREDIALPGLIILEEVLKYFEKDELLISTYGILEASLLSLAKRYNSVIN
ncbi:MAG: HU family DNA-binding protein [Caldimicrobium sp.]